MGTRSPIGVWRQLQCHNGRAGEVIGPRAKIKRRKHGGTTRVGAPTSEGGVGAVRGANAMTDETDKLGAQGVCAV